MGPSLLVLYETLRACRRGRNVVSHRAAGADVSTSLARPAFSSSCIRFVCGPGNQISLDLTVAVAIEIGYDPSGFDRGMSAGGSPGPLRPIVWPKPSGIGTTRAT